MRVFLVSLKNYAKSLKFIFTPLGVLMFFTIIAFSIMIPNCINAVKNLVTNIQDTFGGYNVDINDAASRFSMIILKQDWSNPATAIANITNTDYLVAEVNVILKELFPTLEIDVQTVAEMVKNSVGEVLSNVLAAFVLIILGFLIGQLVAKIFVNTEIKKRKWWQFIVFGLADTFISLFMIYLIILILSSNLGYWSILLIGLLLIIESLIGVIEGWVIHGTKRIPFKKVFKFSSIIFLFLADLLVILIGVGIVLLIHLLGFIALTVVMALSIFSVTYAAVGANAEGYVTYLANEGLLKEKLKAEKNK